jgi:ribosome biogenesis GTPase
MGAVETCSSVVGGQRRRRDGPLTLLENIGYGQALAEQLDLARETHHNPDLKPARVVVEHRGVYQILSQEGIAWAEPTGRLRHQAHDRLDLPAVGDWVAVRRDGRVEALLARRTAFIRKAAGPRTQPQVIAANIDHVFVVTSANQEFNPRRIERYVAAIAESGAAAVLVVNKTDLHPNVDALVDSLGAVGKGLVVARVSALDRSGGAALGPFLGPGRTVALVGSSGVGKSTLANWLLEEDALATGEIRGHDAHGRHTTTHRELLVLPGGGALIDTPGMRELALWSEEADLSFAFSNIEALAASCRFGDCQHTGQPGCALQHALDTGELDPAHLEHYSKLQRELAHQAQRGTVAERQTHRKRSKLIARTLRQRKRLPGGEKLS